VARCGACGQPKIETTNRAGAAVLFGEADDYVRRVVFLEDYEHWSVGTVLYVTGEGVDALIAQGVAALT
jgi:hypothetical protein